MPELPEAEALAVLLRERALGHAKGEKKTGPRVRVDRPVIPAGYTTARGCPGSGRHASLTRGGAHARPWHVTYWRVGTGKTRQLRLTASPNSAATWSQRFISQPLRRVNLVSISLPFQVPFTVASCGPP
jgi:hypothetical protein